MFKKQDSSEENATPTSLRPGGGSIPPSLDKKQSAASGGSTATTGGSASIGPSIRINGDIAGNENLIIHGQVAGSISLPNNMVTIGKEGSIDADVSAQSVDIEGKVSGTVQAAELVRVKPSGYVKGDISAPRVVLEDGCQFRGGIDMQQQMTGAASAKDSQAKGNGLTSPSKAPQDQIKLGNAAKA